jgi:hypothetical protein
MVDNKSLDELELIITLLHDVQTSFSEVFTPRSFRLTAAKLRSRYKREGIGLLTKTLPRLAKSLDRALSGEVPLNSTGFRKIPGSQLPIFMGELLQRIFSHDGWVLPTPCVTCVKHMRQLLLVDYKLELPYETKQEQEVLEKFERTDHELECYNHACSITTTRGTADVPPHPVWSSPFKGDASADEHERLVSRIQSRLQAVFEDFDERDIYPKHGPGSVSTKETGPGKYKWSNISPRIAQTYPIDEYFHVSLGHVCDRLQELQALDTRESSAKVVLVPKDSRGPRLISEEPLDFQWIQQGLGRAIVRHVEHCALTRYNVHFTDQRPNQLGALLGSTKTYFHTHSKTGKFIPCKLVNGRYATLDLKEASDRVTIGLVDLLFPEPLKGALMNCRSLSTVLPSGKVLKLNKFAPMGSALCFPILAMTVWAILDAGSPDADTRESILVYGDDVIVKSEFSEHAIKLLESFGLLVNRDKSCTKGFFRESCGTDAFLGENVTPVRIRTPWASTRHPSTYASWIAYANSFHARQYYATYDLIVKALFAVYGDIPSKDMALPCPSLVEVPEEKRPKVRRTNRDLQKPQWLVWSLKSPRCSVTVDGWMMLLRYFTENIQRPKTDAETVPADAGTLGPGWLPFGSTGSMFSASSYTNRDSTILTKQWLPPSREEVLPRVRPKTNTSVPIN